ncbi:hypothetical protein DVH24_026380 [Malus domestica]|uniref:Prolyl endopeptidase n=1 Tax=Malus domestica TaxID=3750 RepID=A0A498KLD7_MALDO|nr:hypothetical protein DVH24_026380 [Malus domestica]
MRSWVKPCTLTELGLRKPTRATTNVTPDHGPLLKPLRQHCRRLRWAHHNAHRPSSTAPPRPPRPPQKPRASTSTTTRGRTPTAGCRSSTTKWQEEKYTEAVMSVTDRLQSKLQAEIASHIASDLSTPPLLWGPWLYYRRVEEGKQLPVLCRRLASLNGEFISHKSPSSGFDFTSGKRIEQKLIDYNQESQRCGGYAYEELSKVSPDPRFIAYTMYDKEADLFRLSVRNLNSGALCGKPKAECVSNLAWAKHGQALLYVVTDENRRPYRLVLCEILLFMNVILLYCSAIGSTDDDVLILEEPDEEVYVNIQHTKDFHFVTVYTFSTMSSKFQANPLSGVNLVWECNGIAHGILEHHQGFLYLFTDAAKADQSVDYHYLFRSPLHSSSKNMGGLYPQALIYHLIYCRMYLVVILREGQNFKLCSVTVPLPAGKGPVHLKELHPQFLPLPKYVMQISPGPNYDYHSPVMRFTISSPVIPDAVVDYDLSNGNWNIIEQQNIFQSINEEAINSKPLNLVTDSNSDDAQLWKDLSEFYACEQYNVFSYDGVLVPLTVKEDLNPGLLLVHGAYGELLDKRWRSELKSLLDHGWIIAYADVRGGGGGGKKWHHDGRRTQKTNSIKDYISCAKFLVDREIVHENKLAGWGHSAGGLMVASAINQSPYLFKAAILKVNMDLIPLLVFIVMISSSFNTEGCYSEGCSFSSCHDILIFQYTVIVHMPYVNSLFNCFARM